MIEIKSGSHDGDCDTCGWYSDDYITVTRDGVELYHAMTDGHMGGGDAYEAVHDPAVVLMGVLKALGFEVTEVSDV